MTILIRVLRLVIAVAIALNHKSTPSEQTKVIDNGTAIAWHLLISILKVNNNRPMGHIAHMSNNDSNSDQSNLS